MPKYVVTVHETRTVDYEIEADTPIKALVAAQSGQGEILEQLEVCLDLEKGQRPQNMTIPVNLDACESAGVDMEYGVIQGIEDIYEIK